MKSHSKIIECIFYSVKDLMKVCFCRLLENTNIINYVMKNKDMFGAVKKLKRANNSQHFVSSRGLYAEAVNNIATLCMDTKLNLLALVFFFTCENMLFIIGFYFLVDFGRISFETN